MQSSPNPSPEEFATCDQNALAVEVASGSYQYTLFDKTKQQIRLVNLHPPRPATAVPHEQEIIRCDIETFNFESAPEYIALSYTWGSPHDLQHIYIHDKPFIVRQNLFDFLHTFRSEAANKRHLWIDQLCIHQTAVDERNHQVRLMSQIYQKFMFVIMWLGIAPVTQNQATLLVAEPDVATARNLLQNRYFTRLRILQEIWLAPEVCVLCGKIWIPCNSISGIVNELGTLRYLTESRTTQPKASRLKKSFPEESLFNIGKVTLRSAIWRFASMQCEDPRDKVYGLLGFVNDQERPRVNYSKPLYQLYCQTVNSVYQN
jgi:hypothetical protein